MTIRSKVFPSVALTFVTLAVGPLSTQAAVQNTSCDGIAGQWTITNITAFRMTINPNGTGGFHTGITFKWTCHGDSFVFTDSMGITTRMTVSRDRMQMTGAGTMGEKMTAVRNSPLTAVKLSPSSSKGSKQSKSNPSNHSTAVTSGAVKKTSAGNYAKICADTWPRYWEVEQNYDDEDDPFDEEEEHQKFLAYCLVHGVDSKIQEELNDW